MVVVSVPRVSAPIDPNRRRRGPPHRRRHHRHDPCRGGRLRRGWL